MSGASSDRVKLLSEIERAILASNMPAAFELARKGLDAGIGDPLLLHLRAHWHESEDRLDKALEDLEAAKRLAPLDARILNALGHCLFRLDRLDESVTSLKLAASLNPNFAPAQANLGLAWEALDEHEWAERSYRRALELAPNLSEPLARLSSYAARRNDWTQARTYAERALALDPHSSVSLMTLAQADFAAGNLDAAERRIVGLCADPARHPVERATAWNIVGNIRDRQDRIAEAFAAYERSAAEEKTHFASRFSTGGEERAPDLLARLATSFARIPKERWKKPEHSSRPSEDQSAGHVFLVGFPRSGTTLLGQVLANHPAMVTLEERATLIESIRDFIATPDGLDRLAAASDQLLAGYRRAYWQRVREFGVQARGKIVIDKMPYNLQRLPLITRLFPRAKILFAVRDPRDVVFSCFRRMFTIHAFTYELLEPESAARLFDQVMSLAELCRSALALDLLEVRNEDLVADFDGWTRKLCDFLGAEWNQSMRRFAEGSRKRTIATPSSSQVAKGLNRESIAQWRRYETQLKPMFPILAPWVERFGYETN
ncbi:MAG: sulfotransferase [Proteobacteria bacterium]|nr:sulfotransferase [Pseudomonadota bacterium]